MITAKERNKRKLIYLPSKNAQDYFSYCEEVGCEWEGLLNSIPEKIEPAALIELPEKFVEKGFSRIAVGIEVPLEYDKELPESYKIVELPECIMLYFQGEPYENEEDFCKAIESTYTAIGKYNPTLYGYKFAYDIAPSFNFGADTRTGARLAVPALYNDYSEQRILEYKIYDVGKSMFVIKNIIFLVGMISVVSLTACSKADNNQLSRVGIENTEITVLENGNGCKLQ